MGTYHISRKMRLETCVSIVAISSLLLASPVTAQDDPDDDEIIVTATKRAESIIDVPLAITAYSPEFIERTNMKDLKSLVKYTPGFSGETPDSFLDFINVRGISTNDYGNGGDPSVGFFKNNLYQGRTGSASSELFDMERAELLRGPQGFLFGRSAISGAISVHTKKPDYNSNNGYVSLGAGERGIFNAEGAINFSTSDNAAFRLAGYASTENGFVTNTAMPNANKFGGHDVYAFRASAAFKGDTWDANLMVEYEDREQSGTLYRPIEGTATATQTALYGTGFLPGPDPRTVHADMGLGAIDEAEVLSFGAEVNVDLGFATLTSLTGYKDYEYDYSEDYDATTLVFYDYGQDQEGDYFQQEFRMLSETEGPLSWYTGASYFSENINTVFRNRAADDVICGVYYYAYYGTAASTCQGLYYASYYYYGFATPSGILDETGILDGTFSGWAAYLDLTYALSDKLDVSAGVRYQKNKKNMGLDVPLPTSALGPYYQYGLTTDAEVRSTESWDDFTPRFLVRYKPSSDTTLYASVSKGWKSGGNNSFGVDPGTCGPNGDGFAADGITVLSQCATTNDYRPEEIWSYETGIKGNTANGRLRYDLTGYYYDYKDLQLGYFDRGAKVANVGKVKGYGLEASMQAELSENFDFILAAGWNENEIKGANFIEPGSDGNRLPGSPELMASGMLSYHQRMGNNGEVTASVDAALQSDSYSNGLANQQEAELDGWFDSSARIGYKHDSGWGFTVYVENITDEEYFYGGYEGSDTFQAVHFGVSRPRTFGATFTYDWGE